ncbi:CU044_5270 family protein [Streptomyces sp. NPDC002082]|uniref:CU044_5270 family protein n=1 Tax=Streptomyces sp. NPDC002082 TaxID=3154772 RepID=UPI003325410A
MNDMPEHADLAALLPPPAKPELPADRQRLLRGHLMNEISNAEQRTDAVRWPKRLGWIALPALAGGLALTVMLTGGGGGAPAAPQAARPAPVGAVQLLDRVAQVAASKPIEQVKDNQFTYIKSLVAFSGMNMQTNEVIPGTPHQRQIWLSVDGRTEGLVIDEGKPRGSGRTKPGVPAPRPDGGDVIEPRMIPPSLSNPTYHYLAALPTDPDTLLKKIYDEVQTKSPSKDEKAFSTIGDLLREQIAPPAVSAALYRAAAKIPGVTVVEDAVDASGRHGVAVSHVADGTRTEWIFDRNSFEFLGQRDVVVGDSPWGMPAGTVVGASAVLGRAVVDKAGDLPK